MSTATSKFIYNDKPTLQPIEFMCRDISVTFREMVVDDYSAVRALVPSVSTCSDHHTPEHFSMILSLPTFHPFCAYRNDNKELVGYCELLRLPHIGRNFDGRIERVVVTEEFRGRGLASAMCEYLIQQAEENLNCNRIELTVEKPNARHIYETKLGFEPVTTTVMRLRLPRPKETLFNPTSLEGSRGYSNSSTLSEAALGGGGSHCRN